jgi:phospholipid/cholesterol/gamma-HCH transport system permease protein
MPDSSICNWWYIKRSSGVITLVPRGPWRLSNLKRIARYFHRPLAERSERVVIDGSEISELDTAGALLMFEIVKGAEGDFKEIALINFNEQHANLAELVKERLALHEGSAPPKPLTMIEQIGQKTVLIGFGLKQLASFIGEALIAAWEAVRSPRKFRTRELVVQLERVFVDAIPIVCLVTLLIGIVVSYLFAMQLIKYGANIFVVDGVVLAMCRELSPIVVAITLAGRSGSAFTAQIGTMKINQEIDALVTMGLSPMHVLVIPRTLALIIALPLLSFVGDIVGCLGGLAISHWYVGITPSSFFERINTYFPYKSFYFGLMKAPVFAAFIAIIGCQMGLAVENNARSVGLHTTSTVVQSIVSVIIIDAIFAVLFAHAGYY